MMKALFKFNNTKRLPASVSESFLYIKDKLNEKSGVMF